MARIYDEVLEKVLHITADRLGLGAEEVTPGMDFAKDLGADELDCVELVMEYEKEFGLSIPDEVCEGLTSVEKVVDYLMKH